MFDLTQYRSGLALMELAQNLSAVPMSEGNYLVVYTDEIIYIGKAKNLRRRLRQLIRYGEGKANNHKGGKSMWTLPAVWERAQVFYREQKESREREKEMISAFEEKFGELPFANRIH